MLLGWGPLYRTDINHHSHFAFRRRDILSSVSSQASLSLKEQTAPKSELAGASSRLWDVKNIPSPSASSMWLSKLFLKRPSSEKNNSTTLLVPKLLVYPIRQGIWMSVLRTQHGGVMKAITHCQGRWAPQHTLTNLGFLFILSYIWRKGIEWNSRRTKENWLVSHWGR